MPRAAAAPACVVAYHAPARCSTDRKSRASRRNCFPSCGFVVKDVPEGHLCCGSAGTYNILQPEIAERLRDRKIANIEKLEPDVIAAGNIGCITQIAAGTAIPVVHTGRTDRLGDRRADAGNCIGTGVRRSGRDDRGGDVRYGMGKSAVRHQVRDEPYR